MWIARRALVLLIALGIAAGAASAADVVFLVRVGTDSEGNPMFRQADSRDTYLSGLYGLANGSSAVHEAARYYDQVQRDKIAASLQGRASASDIAYATQNVQTEPVYVEVNNNTSGSYNDWKGRFSIQAPNGQVSTISTPRVVLPLGSDVVRSGDSSLLVQTLVHEMGHGGMCKCMLCQGLPNSPYLSKPHSGGSVSDPQLAFIEGWAEFVGAYFTGRHTIAQDPANALDTNWYAKNSDGSMKSAQQLVSCEGWNATVMLQISEQAKDQNAMWKMTQVMSRTTPQSTWELLQNTAAMFPELAPSINQVVYQYSGGQIQGVAPAPTYAAAGNTAYAAAPGGQSAAAAPTGDPGQQYAGSTQYAQTAADGSTLSAGSMSQDTASLEQAYVAKKAQYDATPWYSFLTKFKLKKELGQIEDVYAKQADMTTAYQSAAAPSTYTGATGGVAPGSAAAPRKSYTSVVDSLKGGDTSGVSASLDAYRAADAARKAAAAAGPQGER